MGPGSQGASGEPRPFPLAHHTALCARFPGTSARLLGLQTKPASPCAPLRSTPAPGLAFLDLCLCTLPGQLPGTAGASPGCPGGVPGEPACALWAWVAGEEARCALGRTVQIIAVFWHDHLLTRVSVFTPSAPDPGLGMCLLPLEPVQSLWVDNNSSRNPS